MCCTWYVQCSVLYVLCTWRQPSRHTPTERPLPFSFFLFLFFSFSGSSHARHPQVPAAKTTRPRKRQFGLVLYIYICTTYIPTIQYRAVPRRYSRYCTVQYSPAAYIAFVPCTVQLIRDLKVLGVIPHAINKCYGRLYSSKPVK